MYTQAGVKRQKTKERLDDTEFFTGKIKFIKNILNITLN